MRGIAKKSCEPKYCKFLILEENKVTNFTNSISSVVKEIGMKSLQSLCNGNCHTKTSIGYPISRNVPMKNRRNKKKKKKKTHPHFGIPRMHHSSHGVLSCISAQFHQSDEDISTLCSFKRFWK